MIAGILGSGFIVNVNVRGVPLQPLNVGVAVKFPDIAVVPVLVPINEEIFPFPEAPIPIAVFEFVQAMLEVAGVTVKVIAVLFAFAQIVWLVTAVKVGDGSTVIVYDDGMPTHPLSVGVTVMVDVIVAPVVLVAVNAGMFALPLAAKPIAVFEFVQV